MTGMLKARSKSANRGSDPSASPVLAPAACGVASLRDSEFFRLPKPGTRDALANLSRTSILQYGEAGCFKLIRLKRRGASRGAVLVGTKSFLEWLHRQPVVTKGGKQ
jgi:hypothetical protein